METHCHTPLEREPLLIEHDLFVSIMEKMRSDWNVWFAGMDESTTCP